MDSIIFDPPAVLPRFKVADCVDPDVIVVLAKDHDDAMTANYLAGYNKGFVDRDAVPPLKFWQRFFTKAADHRKKDTAA